jgi:acyl homoserine lactone synthase
MSLQTITAVSRYVEHHTVHNPIFFREGDLTVKNLVSDEDKLHAYRLRNNIFCNELGWALQSQNGLEIDEYDKHAISLGVLDERGELLAFLRIILAERAFMIEKEFLSLVDPRHAIRKESDTIELSRLCVAPKSRKDKVAGNFGMYYISMLLFKGVYQWCLKNHTRHLYAVTEHKIYKLLCLRGFPCSLIGDPYVMPDGVIAVAFIVDLREWEAKHTAKSPKLFNWFSLV